MEILIVLAVVAALAVIIVPMFRDKPSRPIPDRPEPIPARPGPTGYSGPYAPTGTAATRKSRRAQARRSLQRRKARPAGLLIYRGMYWDDFLGEVCYFAEEAAYIAELDLCTQEQRNESPDDAWEGSEAVVGGLP